MDSSENGDRVKNNCVFCRPSIFQDFFRNLSHWMQQHMDMNDAGNFLIETCDDTVSRDLKQQLLLLNGRWRELFVKVKHVNTMPFITTVP